VQVIAFATPARADWRWRIVDYAGMTVEESFGAFPSIASAVAEGTRRLDQMTSDEMATRATTYRPAVRAR
jgi:hypothetical protein